MSSINWQTAIKAVCAGLIFVCTVVTILLAGPALEGKLFSVVGPFEITRTVALSPDETAVYGCESACGFDADRCGVTLLKLLIL